jgi:hypothetical protein
MGVWSDEILGNDLAADVAGEYRDALLSGGPLTSPSRSLWGQYQDAPHGPGWPTWALPVRWPSLGFPPETVQALAIPGCEATGRQRP